MKGTSSKTRSFVCHHATNLKLSMGEEQSRNCFVTHSTLAPFLVFHFTHQLTTRERNLLQDKRCKYQQSWNKNHFRTRPAVFINQIHISDTV